MVRLIVLIWYVRSPTSRLALCQEGSAQTLGLSEEGGPARSNRKRRQLIHLGHVHGTHVELPGRAGALDPLAHEDVQHVNDGPRFESVGPRPLAGFAVIADEGICLAWTPAYDDTLRLAEVRRGLDLELSPSHEIQANVGCFAVFLVRQLDDGGG